MNRPATLGDVCILGLLMLVWLAALCTGVNDQLTRQHAESEANLIKAVQVIRQGQRDLEKLEKKPRPILPGLEGLK